MFRAIINYDLDFFFPSLSFNRFCSLLKCLIQSLVQEEKILKD